MLDKVSADIKKKNLTANLTIIKIISKPKENLMAMKLQIFGIKEFSS